MIFIKKLTLCFFIIFICSPAAYAYIDPVTGSLIIQGLIAAVVGALAMIKFQYSRFKAFINKIFGRNAKDDSLDSLDSLDSFEAEQDFSQKKEKNSESIKESS